MILKRDSRHLTTNPSVSVPSASGAWPDQVGILRKACTNPETHPIFSSSCSVPFASKLSTLNPLCVKSFKFRTSSKDIHNPFRIRTFKTQNSFRLCSYKKNGRGEGPRGVPGATPPGVPPPLPESSAQLRELCVSALSFLLLFPLLTTHHCLLTSPIFCLQPSFLLSSPPQGENAHVCK